MILILNSWHYHRTGDRLEPLFGCKSSRSFFSWKGVKVWKRITRAASHSAVALIQRKFPVLWFSSKKLSSDEEAWKITNFLCIVISHEEQGLIRDKTLRSSAGKDKQNVYKGSFSWEIKYLKKKVGQKPDIRPAKTKQCVGSLLLDFLGNNTETACSGAEMYHTLAIVVRPALLELSQKRRWADCDVHRVTCITSFTSICVSLRWQISKMPSASHLSNAACSLIQWEHIGEAGKKYFQSFTSQLFHT